MAYTMEIDKAFLISAVSCGLAASLELCPLTTASTPTARRRVIRNDRPPETDRLILPKLLEHKHPAYG
jgi:hypothetical protein